ncbi:SIS domain-containing protein [Amycolatopsis sp. CA-230715]|uniref:SIS domain-containing protein n=1 Tax=Amycolatopsis sp. CA-230715 TaxID=2745196 RepID=UPI001C030804|nr:SIS domain-containing protein [Amycolatopsis sp. CA-230715]QWF78336.1 Glutamine--fructose-6-phosphate aminotransferase [isomerizing] [Amycolatopsis sp. CA-230715]
MTRSFMDEEIASQPECWQRAVGLADELSAVLPAPGRRIAVVGCGTSRFIGESYGVLRETAGLGQTDVFAASEFPRGRQYDEVLAISRSGTTTEVLRLLAELRGRVPTTVITGVPGEIAHAADRVVDLSYSDERSVVQTRFATTTLALLRANLGEDLSGAIEQARAALDEPIAAELREADQFTFLGTGWTVGIANEAALKFREAALTWTESYPAWEYRHGPISISQPGRVTWMFGAAPEGMASDVAKTGATFVDRDVDPLADLVLAQRVAGARAADRGLDPDHPRSLTRSVVLQ